MEPAAWVAFLAASAAVLAVPGPTVTLVVAHATAQGRAAALAILGGVALGDLVAITAALCGVGALLLASAELFALVKWLGAAYLAWLGIALWRSGSAGPGTARPLRQGALFRRAFMVTALNPKSIAFFVAFAPQFVDPAAAYAPQAGVMIASFVALAALNAMAYALLADRAGRRLRTPRVRRWLARAGGGALMAMAATTALARRA